MSTWIKEEDLTDVYYLILMGPLQEKIEAYGFHFLDGYDGLPIPARWGFHYIVVVDDKGIQVSGYGRDRREAMIDALQEIESSWR